MALVVLLILGLMSLSYIPVSLVPDIDVPIITVYIDQENTSGRELENTIANRLRSELIQVQGVSDVQSISQDGSAVVKLVLEFGTDVDLAFLEVNERVDQVMTSFPHDISRPKVVKSSISDIPVFYLNLTLKNTDGYSQQMMQNQFIELSTFASQVIRKRLEQLPEIAIVDMSGGLNSELVVIPDLVKLQPLNVTTEELESIIKDSNLTLGNFVVQNGPYQHNLKFRSHLSSKNDIEEINLKIRGRIIPLKNVASVVERPHRRAGLVLFNNQEAISLAVIKQSGAQMNALKDALSELIKSFEKDYPDIQFSVTRDQTHLLDSSISNLMQDLFWGGILALLTMSFFLNDRISPILISLVLPISLLICILGFYLVDISVNIISLSGLVLSIGMMIDNSIIVMDNISQHKARGYTTNQSCTIGTKELITPMFSSALTTCVVFFPLIFISGIAGAMFYDEAVAVIIGTGVSLILSITIIPAFYKILHSRKKNKRRPQRFSADSLKYEKLYKLGFKKVMRHQWVVFVCLLILLTSGIFIYLYIPKSTLPMINRDEVAIKIDWNENVSAPVNKKRTEDLIKDLSNSDFTYTAFIGVQDFLLEKRKNAEQEVSIYFKVYGLIGIDGLQKQIIQLLKNRYPQARYKFMEVENIFNILFSQDEPPLTARLRPLNEKTITKKETIQSAIESIRTKLPEAYIQDVPFKEQIVLKIDLTKLMLYDIPYPDFAIKLKNKLTEHSVISFSSNQESTQVVISQNQGNIDEILWNSKIESIDGKQYPMREFLSRDREADLKEITADKQGEFYPIDFNVTESESKRVIDSLQFLYAKNKFIVSFTGNIFAANALIKELTVILLISLLMLYLILAAQFESLSLPLIILFEIPIDICGALIFLEVFGSGLNLMSLIGLIIMTGIIINDSILKIDTINQLRKKGIPLLKAIMIGGQRRLKSILMTSLTTILAIVPLFITPGIGSDLQKPLALALTGGMFFGTIVSLYVIPMIYYHLEKYKLRPTS
jgi:multidrug efflux pump subunit AcrB